MSQIIARQVCASEYGATEIGCGTLRALSESMGASNDTSDFCVDWYGEQGSGFLSHDQINAIKQRCFEEESGERFYAGEGYDLSVMRFVITDGPVVGQEYSLIWVEGHLNPYPTLVAGHITNRDDAIAEWIGDTEAADHPDLYLSTSGQA